MVFWFFVHREVLSSMDKIQWTQVLIDVLVNNNLEEVLFSDYKEVTMDKEIQYQVGIL